MLRIQIFTHNWLREKENDRSLIVVASNSSATIRNSSFLFNIGRCLHSLSNATVVVRNSTFINNTLPGHMNGAVISSEGPSNFVYLSENTTIKETPTSVMGSSLISAQGNSIQVSGTNMNIDHTTFYCSSSAHSLVQVISNSLIQVTRSEFLIDCKFGIWSFRTWK